VSNEFPSPTVPFPSRAELFLGYFDWFRSRLVAKLEELGPEELRSSRLPSGWTPLELLKHLTYVELRWIEWGFEGCAVAEPWGDQREERWYVAPEETLESLVAQLHARAAHTRAVVRSADLDAVGEPGPRWSGAEPATLERVLFHVLQEYARHLGHLDIVAELAAGSVGE
jgi:uncharacterized damage-inducible protein DinB